jgi:hypothetical protein
VPAGRIATATFVPATASMQRWTVPSPPQTNSTSAPCATARRAYSGAKRLLVTSFQIGSVTPSSASTFRSSGKPPPNFLRECATTATSVMPGSHPSPARFAQPVDAEDGQSECGQDHQELAEWLIAQREQCLVDAA